jgi:uncharacterized protein (DUF58 family)
VLTRQGWVVAGGAIALFTAGRILGLVELIVLASAAGLLVVASALHVMRTRLDLEVGRSVHPPRVHVGNPSRVELAIKNLGAMRTPVLQLRDPVSGTRGADLLLPPLTRNERATAAYRLPTDRRGLLRIGPLRVIVTDPFGLVAADTVGAPASELTVYPHVDEISPVPYTTGHDPLSGAKQPNSLGRTGEDFYALRPYVVGDDLRRVHWPSTARHDELLVRQHELPWQGRTTVLLDVRRSAHRGESLELAVSLAASVVTANWKRHDLVRLITTDGADSGFAVGYPHLEALLEHLAVVPAASSASLRGMIDVLGRGGNGGALVAVVAEASDDELTAINRLRTNYGSVTIVALHRSAWDASAAPPPPSSAAGPGVLRVTSAQPFVPVWNRAIAMMQGGRRAAAAARTRASGST